MALSSRDRWTYVQNPFSKTVLFPRHNDQVDFVMRAAFSGYLAGPAGSTGNRASSSGPAIT
ncbi:hypothetical protein PHJA_001410800 [Phtheirospermum japonicum]|uniref:Uncharacterized protein n=1 Tax=Phtheirospermum japonicum TaxID=374723 RepID=A0A830C0L6_9LAMI|nr:hypothetical protein PHJA_001410800 [Phtheirospermum japonicum]